MRKVSPWYLLSYISRGRGKIDRGYSTGAEMALEMLQAGEGSAAILAREGLSVSGTLLLDLCRLLVLHIGGLLGFLGGQEGKEFEAL